jgi:DivIVA domain-containing protein
MALSPQRIRETQFKAARRGYDQAEVDAFVQEVAAALETAQNDATAMEARARAAVARLQELSQGAADASPTGTAAPEEARAHVDESETISRTLLLAQRTADQAVADAQVEADRLLAAAQQDASGRLDAARSEATELVEAAKVDARRDGEAERVRVEGEVQALLARRDFLESDVEHLEQFVMAQRERIVEATSELQALCQRVPAGLADMRRPLLSAAHEPSDPEGLAATPNGGGEADGGDGTEPAGDTEISEITRVAAAEQAQAAEDDVLPPPDADREPVRQWGPETQ